jgi:hypothetical protein
VAGKEELAERAVEATLFVERQYKGRDPEERQETLSVHRYLTEPAKVTVGYGLTLNLGNYEFARLYAEVSLPCYKEEHLAALAYAKNLLGEKIAEEVADIRSGAKSGSTGL